MCCVSPFRLGSQLSFRAIQGLSQLYKITTTLMVSRKITRFFTDDWTQYLGFT